MSISPRKMVVFLVGIAMDSCQLGALSSHLSSVTSEKDCCGTDEKHLDPKKVISFHSDVPSGLQEAMKGFIEQYPNWDQYRLIQAALAGFLVQNGVESRSITRLYVGNMFRHESSSRN